MAGGTGLPEASTVKERRTSECPDIAETGHAECHGTLPQRTCVLRATVFWRHGPQASELLYAPIPSTTQKGHGYFMKMRPIYVAGVSGKQIVIISYYSLASWYSRQRVPGVGRTLTACEQGRLTPEDSRVHSSEKTAPRCVSYIKHSPGGAGGGGLLSAFPRALPRCRVHELNLGTQQDFYVFIPCPETIKRTQALTE